jgi:hypothetical protein
MHKNLKQEKICNCSNPTNKDIFKHTINHSFCNKCGSILIKSNHGNIHYILKPKQKQKPIDFDPIQLIKSMKKKTEKEYPYLNNEFNMNTIQERNKEVILKSINTYLKYRKMIILTLQKLMKLLDFSDLIFYQSLFYTDNYLSHHMDQDMSEKKILYYLVGFFLCSAKFKETDIYEPNLDSFCCLKKKIYLSIDKIAYYEVACLQAIKYNVFSYSAYDWLSELISIGIVFDCEINKNNSIILINGHRHSILNTISKYAMKMLLTITVKTAFVKYSPMYIAFSLIQLSREKYLDKANINTKLFNYLISLYGVNYNDYKPCYKELKKEIERRQEENNENIKEDKKEENEHEKENEETFDIEKLKKGSQDDVSKENRCKMDKNIIVNNKMQSSNTIIHLKQNLEQIKKESQNDINNNNNDKITDNNENNRQHSKYNHKHNKKDENIIQSDSKDENIIVFEENNDEKNNDMLDIECNNIEINKKDETSNETNDTNNNKMKSSHDLTHIKLKNKNHLFINCNNNVFKSNDNLPHINPNLDPQSIDSKSKRKKNENKHSSSKEINNKFLKTNQKTLNPIKNKRSMSNKDNKRYYQNNANNNANTINHNNNSGFKPKEGLDSIRKSLFYDNSNNNKQINKEPKGLMNTVYDNMKFPPRISHQINSNSIFSNNIKDDDKLDNTEDQKKAACKSKGKSNNNLVGKETKAYIPNKRNQSTNQIKRRVFKSTLDAKNGNADKNNLEWKNI